MNKDNEMRNTKDAKKVRFYLGMRMGNCKDGSN